MDANQIILLDSYMNYIVDQENIQPDDQFVFLDYIETGRTRDSITT